jgi:nicotinamide riboside kinase
MSDPTFMARLAQAIQTQHEATIVLQQLASELVDHAMRMRSWTDKLQAHLVAPETPARARQDVVVPETPAVSYAAFSNEPMVLPKVLRGGPQVRDG